MAEELSNSKQNYSSNAQWADAQEISFENSRFKTQLNQPQISLSYSNDSIVFGADYKFADRDFIDGDRFYLGEEFSPL